jgi:predicted peptidase
MSFYNNCKKKSLTAVSPIVITVLILIACNRDSLYGTAEESASPVLEAHSLKINENCNGYYSGLPMRYGDSGNKQTYPAIICFHGGGGYGQSADDLPNALEGVIYVLRKPNVFPPAFESNGKKHSFIVLAPQFIRYPDNSEIKSFIEYCKQTYRLDTSRIYLAGMSIGGRMACDYAAEYPFETAAVVAMAGCSDDNIYDKCKSLADANVPIWNFHNRDDEAWPVTGHINFHNMINSFRPHVLSRLTIFDIPEGERGHNAWRRASDPKFDEDGLNIYEWMLQYHR